jgi:hypothetical protein
LRSWVDTFEPLTEAPAEAQLAVAIAIVSAGVGWKAPIRWGTSSEPCTISTILEGGSAMGRKTTTMNGARSVVHEATGDIPTEHRGLFVDMVGHTSDVGLLELVAPKDQAEADRWEAGTPPGHVLNWDEMGSILGDPGISRKGGDWHGRTRTTILNLANGRHSGIKTGAKKVAAAPCAVAIVGTMTRIELEQRIDTGLLRDGFIGRFMLIPHNGRARLLSQPPPWTPSQVEAKNEIVQWVRNLSERRERFGDAFSLFTEAALAERHRWYVDTTKHLERAVDRDPTDATRAAAEAFARLQTTQVKLAVVAAVSDMPTSQLLTATPIVTLGHVQWAQSVIDTSFQEVVELANGGGRNDEDAYRDRVIAHLQNHGARKRRDILHDCTFKTLTAQKRWSIIRDMHAEGSLQITLERGNGRPAQLVDIPTETGAYGQLTAELRPYTADADTTAKNGRNLINTAISTAESPTANGSTTPLTPTYDLMTDKYIHREEEGNPPETPPNTEPTAETAISPEPFINTDDDIPF